MNSKKIFAAIIIFAAVLNFTACQSKEEQYHIKTKNSAYYDMGYNVYENGLIYTVSKTLGTQAYFLDYETMNGVPICNKPNCVHNDESCLSKICGTTPIIYNDFVYYFESNNEIVDSEDKKSQNCYVYSKCMRASLKTGEIQTFAEFEGVDPTECYRYVLNGKTLYFIGAYNAYQWNDGTWSYSSSGGMQYLCSIDLESGKFNNYGLVNDSPYAENNTVLEGNGRNSISDQVILSGIYNNKIYMYYQYVEEQQELIDALHNSQVDLENDVPWIYENKCFDLETEKMTISKLPKAEEINENTYLYWDNTKKAYIILNGEETEIIASRFEKTWEPHIINGKLWSFGEKPQCFDVASAALYEIANNNCTENDSKILAYENEKYIVQYSNNDSFVFEEVTESDLIGGAK